MIYMKLVAHGPKRQLMKEDQLEQGTTLCGCVMRENADAIWASAEDEAGAGFAWLNM